MSSNNVKVFTIKIDDVMFIGNAVFESNGGDIHIYGLDGREHQMLRFNTTDIRDLGNFLVSFLHRRGYPEPTICIGETSYHYIEPEMDVVIDAIKCDLKDRYVVYPSYHPNYDLFRSENFSSNFKVRMYSNNDAINEILHHNQLSYDLVRKRGVIKLLQEKVLRGHTTIKESLRGEWYYLRGDDGVRFAINIPFKPILYYGEI